jgi:hypothetical protein
VDAIKVTDRDDGMLGRFRELFDSAINFHSVLSLTESGLFL